MTRKKMQHHSKTSLRAPGKTSVNCADKFLSKNFDRKWFSTRAQCFLILGVFILLSITAKAQTKQVALTMDDLPLNGAQFELKRLQTMTGKILNGIKKHKIPAVGFVDEGLIYIPNETDERIETLKQWSNAGVELGNHGFSHLGFSGATIAAYEDDFIKGDTITRMILKSKNQTPRYFRHPFLQTGATAEIENSFENFIAERGYKSVPVTMDTLDWMFSAAYLKAIKANDAKLKKRISEDYLKFVAQKIEASETSANALFGRSVKHILLSHANEINADNFDALVQVFTGKGYQFVTVEEALKDEIYKTPEKYDTTSDWLWRWAAEKNMKLNTPVPPEYIRKAFQNN